MYKPTLRGKVQSVSRQKMQKTTRPEIGMYIHRHAAQTLPERNSAHHGILVDVFGLLVYIEKRAHSGRPASTSTTINGQDSNIRNTNCDERRNRRQVKQSSENYQNENFCKRSPPSPRVPAAYDHDSGRAQPRQAWPCGICGSQVSVVDAQHGQAT
jgi:hypothetical protein